MDTVNHDILSKVAKDNNMSKASVEAVIDMTNKFIRTVIENSEEKSMYLSFLGTIKFNTKKKNAYVIKRRLAEEARRKDNPES